MTKCNDQHDLQLGNFSQRDFLNFSIESDYYYPFHLPVRGLQVYPFLQSTIFRAIHVDFQKIPKKYKRQNTQFKVN